MALKVSFDLKQKISKYSFNFHYGFGFKFFVFFYPGVSALVSKLNSSLAASNLFCKDTNNDKGNSSTNQNDKKIKEILPWLSSFNNRCRSAVGSKNIKLFESLLMLYLRY